MSALRRSNQLKRSSDISHASELSEPVKEAISKMADGNIAKRLALAREAERGALLKDPEFQKALGAVQEDKRQAAYEAAQRKQLEAEMRAGIERAGKSPLDAANVSPSAINNMALEAAINAAIGGDASGAEEDIDSLRRQFDGIHGVGYNTFDGSAMIGEYKGMFNIRVETDGDGEPEELYIDGGICLRPNRYDLMATTGDEAALLDENGTWTIYIELASGVAPDVGATLDPAADLHEDDMWRIPIGTVLRFDAPATFDGYHLRKLTQDWDAGPIGMGALIPDGTIDYQIPCWSQTDKKWTPGWLRFHV